MRIEIGKKKEAGPPKKKMRGSFFKRRGGGADIWSSGVPKKTAPDPRERVEKQGEGEEAPKGVRDQVVIGEAKGKKKWVN